MVDWKKEVSLSDLARRKKREDGEAAAPAPAEPQERPASTSFLKKEISFGRKKAPKAVEEPRAEAGNTSVFKRELSVGRKRKDSPPAAKDATPFWKKEIAIGRKRSKVAAPAPDPEEVALAAFLQPSPAVEEVAAGAEPVAEAEPLVAAEPVAEADEYGWLADSIEPTDESAPSWVDLVEASPAIDEPLEPALELEDAVEPVVAEEPEIEPEPIPASIALPEPEPQPEIEIPSAVAVPPEIPAPLAGIHPPVAASELPPLPAEEPAQEKKPFYRRELSLGRKPKQPKEAKQAKQPKPKKEKGAPFWKRDLSKAKDQAPKQDEAAKERAPKVKAPKRMKGEKRGQRHKKVVGLKVGASQIAAARVVNNGAAQLVQVARDQLEPGIVVGGELRDPDALAEALKAFFKKHKLPKRGVRLGIANNRIGVRSFDLDGIDDPKQLANAIRFRAQEALPIPIEEAVLDYHVLGESQDAEGKLVRRVLLVVAYRELIDRYVDACRKAGIRLVGIDLEAFALLRALGAPRGSGEAPPQAATVAVAVGYDRSTFAVSDGRVCEFTRVLEWGGFAVNVAIARALDIAPSEAESIKRALSLAGGEVPEGLTAEQAEVARDAMRKQVGSFARELVSSLQFYQSQSGSLSIASITLTGGTAHLPGLADELRRLIGVPVDIGDPLARVRVGKKVRTGEQVGSFAVAIGLGIED